MYSMYDVQYVWAADVQYVLVISSAMWVGRYVHVVCYAHAQTEQIHCI